MLQRHHPSPTPQTVVYVTRGKEAGTALGRTTPDYLNTATIRVIKHRMATANRAEKLVVFTGKTPEGHGMSYRAQFDLFRSASLVIGAHGTGLGGLRWMPLALPCPAQSRHVIEMTCGPHFDTQKNYPHWQKKIGKKVASKRHGVPPSTNYFPNSQLVAVSNDSPNVARQLVPHYIPGPHPTSVRAKAMCWISLFATTQYSSH